jgi:uncharacterized membrane protein YcaP (DUF421 family)
MALAGRAGWPRIHDLLVIVLIAEAAQNGMTGDYRTVPNGLLLVAVILAWSVAIDALSWRGPRLEHILKPRPKPLVVD